jgi:hypothetical protein
VTLSTDHLPRDKPRYLMGVGYVPGVLCGILRFILILTRQTLLSSVCAFSCVFNYSGTNGLVLYRVILCYIILYLILLDS